MTDIARWLVDLGLGQYAPSFEQHAIDKDVLPHLDHALLQQLGVEAIGDRIRILKAAEQLPSGVVDPQVPRGVAPPLMPLPASAPAMAPASSSTAQAERRQLTVMFVDLVGSTDLSRRLDPEELREINRAFQDATTERIERFGGYVARYMGDGVLAYFGYPQAHEDDAERAVHAGLAIAEAIPALEPGGLAVRTGIATGPVVVGDLVGAGASQESAVVGETPNLAARLQALARPGTVLISQATHALVGATFRTASIPPQTLKGFAEPVPVIRVLEARTDATRFEALRTDALSPLIGRDSELAMVCDRWQQAKAGDGQLVLINGEPGIGKSRLVHAFLQTLQADEPISMIFQCSPHHTRSPFFPVLGGLDRAAGIARSDSDAVQRQKLDAWLACINPQSNSFAKLARALVLPTEEGAGVSPRELHLQFLADLIASPARPVALLFEDMHWADATTLEAVRVLMEDLARERVLVLMTARPEFEPQWTAPENNTVLSLGRLGRRHRAQLVAALGRDRVMSEAIMHRIIEQTDGVPLFVEEVTQALLANAADSTRDDDASVPATLHDSLLERLDQLGDAKRVAQQAAVIGREFSRKLLTSAVAPLDVDMDAALQQLLVSGLVSTRRGTDQGEYYTFKHALVRDAAYESLLRADRREAHATIAAALAQIDADVSNIEQLAWHYEHAGDALNAVKSWLQAAQIARGRLALLEAAELAASGLRALVHLAPCAERDALEIELQFARGLATRFTVGVAAPEFRASFERVRTLTKGTGHPRLTRALFELSRLHVHNRDRASLQEIHDAFSAYLESDNTIDCMLAHTNAISTYLYGETPGDAYAHIHRLGELLNETVPVTPAQRPHHELRITRGAAMSTLCRAAATLGNFDTALAAARTALEEGEAAGPGAVAPTLSDIAFLHIAAGDVASGRNSANRIVELANRARQPVFATMGRTIICIADALDGHEAAIETLMAWQGRTDIAGRMVEAAIGYLLFALIQRAEWDCVNEIVTRELPQAQELGWTPQLSSLLSAKAMSAALQASPGSKIEADAVYELQRLIHIALTGGALSRALGHAKQTARLFLRSDRKHEAREALESAYGAFTEGFNTPLLRETRALIDELA